MIESKCDYLVVKYKDSNPNVISMKNFLQCLKINYITPEYHYDWLQTRYGDKLEYIAGAKKISKEGDYEIIAKVNKEGKMELL